MKVLILLGSARKVRLTPIIGKIVLDLVSHAHPHVQFELVDLKQWKLPFDAEEAIPMAGNYTSEEILQWSKKVSSASGIMVISPQYNWGYPAVLKNAIDQLYQEFVGKPVLIITFGGHGGDKCSEQLRQVLGGGLKMEVTATCPKITISRENIISHQIDEAELAARIEQSVLDLAGELLRLMEKKF